jgi:hypothetical protein
LWEARARSGHPGSLRPHKRGPKPEQDPLVAENQTLVRENQRLTEKLRTAEIIVDVQKKVAMLFGHPLLSPEPEEKL